MMTNGANDELPLAAEFPPASYAQWRRLAEAALKGARFEEGLTGRAAEGLRIAPLYARAPSAARVVPRAGGTRWHVLTRIDHPDPAAANAQVLLDLANGATGIMLVGAGAAGAHGYGLLPTPGAI